MREVGPKRGEGNHTADEEEDSREGEGDESDWPLSGNNSSTNGVYFTRDNKSSMEGTDGKSREEEESLGWHTVARRRG